jgi:hypothetical protein
MDGTHLSVQALQSLPGGPFVVPLPANDFFSHSQRFLSAKKYRNHGWTPMNTDFQQVSAICQITQLMKREM